MLLPLGAVDAQEAGESFAAEDIDARVAKLEAEIAALRIMIGALEAAVVARPSLLPDGERSESDSDLGARVRALEVQIGALTNQLDQFAAKLDDLRSTQPDTAEKMDDDTTKRTPPPEAKPAEQKPAKPSPAEAKKTAAPKTPEPKTPESKAPESKATEPKTAEPKTPDKSAPEQETAEVDPEPRPRPAKTSEAPAPKTPAPKTPAPKITPPERKPPIEEARREPEPDEADIPIPPSLAPVVPPAGRIDDPSKPRWYGLRPESGSGVEESPGTTGALPKKAPRSRYPSKAAQVLYEQGYGDYLRRDYAGAEASFGKLVKTHPDDPLAGSAQYWVGETQFLRKQYQKAADSFLAGYRKYAGSEKAPDTLLRLGMSLAALGKTTAACSTFKELDSKFPDAPASVQRQAKGAAEKAGC